MGRPTSVMRMHKDVIWWSKGAGWKDPNHYLAEFERDHTRDRVKDARAQGRLAAFGAAHLPRKFDRQFHVTSKIGKGLNQASPSVE